MHNLCSDSCVAGSSIYLIYFAIPARGPPDRRRLLCAIVGRTDGRQTSLFVACRSASVDQRALCTENLKSLRISLTLAPCTVCVSLFYVNDIGSIGSRGRAVGIPYVYPWPSLGRSGWLCRVCLAQSRNQVQPTNQVLLQRNPPAPPSPIRTPSS